MKMKLSKIINWKFLLVLLLLNNSKTWAQTPFTPGNIVVVRVGDGSIALSSAANPVFLDEYNPSGTLIRSIKMPVTGLASTDTSNKFVMGGTNVSVGMLSRSSNGKFLTVVGYNNVVGVSSTQLNSATLTPRTFAVINYNGSVNTNTVVTDVGSSTAYCAVSNDGVNLWGCFASSGIGLRYTTIGSTSTTSINTNSGYRGACINNGQLYVSDGTNGNIAAVGTGLPTTGPQTATVLPGIPATGFPVGQSQFFFADLNPGIAGSDVLYIANEGDSALQKYSFNGITWKSNGIIGTTADDYRGITGVINGNTVTLYCMRKGGTSAAGGGELVTLTDTSGYMGAFTGTPAILATAANQTAFRGVSLAPVKCSPPNIVLNNIGPTSVDVNWASVGTGAGYEYAISPNPIPPVSGTYTTSLSYNATNLVPGIQYYVHLRSNCSGNDFSLWNTVTFLTTWPPCVAPIILAPVNNIDNTVSINWNPVLSGVNYEYAITNSAIPPSSGSFTSTTSYTASGLTGATQYYFHVRVYCGSGTVSPWSSKPFFTACFKPVLSLIANDPAIGTADVSWKKVKGVQGYEYAVLPTGASISGSTTSTSDTVLHLSKLNTIGNYYLHIRSICSGTNFSEWSVIQFNVSGIAMFPNPASDKVTIRVFGKGIANEPVFIYNENGKLMKQLTLTGNSITASVSGWAAGLYYVRYGSEKTYVSTIMKL
jgi:hypothetical protein